MMQNTELCLYVSLDETFPANDLHTYKDRSGQIRTAAAHPGFKGSGMELRQEYVLTVQAPKLRPSYLFLLVVLSSFEGFYLDRLAESAKPFFQGHMSCHAIRKKKTRG